MAECASDALKVQKAQRPPLRTAKGITAEDMNLKYAKVNSLGAIQFSNKIQRTSREKEKLCREREIM